MPHWPPFERNPNRHHPHHLMTYETAISGQAEMEKFSRSTFSERKIMSTKTSIKRIAAVAAVALTLGGFSAVSAHAGQTGACTAWTVHTSGVVSSINALEDTNNTDTVNAAQSVDIGATLTAMAATGDTTNCASQRFSAFISSAPTGGLVGVTSAAAATPTTQTGTSLSVTSPNIDVEQTTTQTATTAAAVKATAAGAAYGVFSFTPTKAGTYVLTVWNDLNQDGIVQATEVAQTVSITISAITAFSPTLSTVYTANGVQAAQNAAAAAAAVTATSSLTPVVQPGALPAAASSNRGVIGVTLKNTSGSLTTNYTSISATVSGSGFVVAEATSNAIAPANCPTTATGTRSVTVAQGSITGSIQYFLICSDGTSGTGTYTIKALESDGLTTDTLASKTVTFTGKAATFTATGVLTIAKSGGAQLGTATAARTSTFTTKPSAVIHVVDSAGLPVPGLASSITEVSSDTTVLNTDKGGSTCTEDDGSSTIYSSGGAGYYNCYITSAPSATSGAKATMTFRMLDPNDPNGLAYLTATVNYTIGGSVKTESLSLDSTSYATGGAMVLTVSALDSSGNPVYDGAATPATWTASKSVVGLPAAASNYVGGKKTYSTGVYAPALAGPFTISATGTDSAATTISVASSVTADTSATDASTAAANASTAAANAAVDAANEATDAANAATDAANNAMDSADAAQQAALDAGDKADAALAAVTDLATKVSAIASQIASLSALVKKIASKVKA
jgi:trimeric autotransporter adhesin